MFTTVLFLYKKIKSFIFIFYIFKSLILILYFIFGQKNVNVTSMLYCEIINYFEKSVLFYNN